MQIKSCHFVAALSKGIGVKCVTMSMISSGRQTEGNGDKTYQLVGDAYTPATVTRVPRHVCISRANNAKLPRACIATPFAKKKRTGQCEEFVDVLFHDLLSVIS